MKRQYPFKAYTHLDTNVETKIEKDTRVYHVTKEFGPATLTELGKTVTALAAAQQASNLTKVAVVMPFYTFTRRLVTDKEIDMVMDIRGKKPGQIMSVEFRVWKMMYAFNPPVQAPSVYEWQMINNVNTSVLITPQRPPAPTDVIPVYMIGSANRRPFSQAFKCRTVSEMNIENELPLEWRDQYFAKAAATFLAHKATASDEESIFAPIRIVPRVDIVHIHGASNAYVAKFLQDKKEADDLGPRPPAIVYTMYNQEEEMQYTNTFRNVRKFLDHLSDRDALRKYVYGGKMYMSKLAMDFAEAVIYPNRTMAAEVVEGRRDFHLKELVMDALLKKADGARFYGINSAIDFHSTEHPFITDKLINRTMGFPKYAYDAILDQPYLFSSSPLRPLSLEPPSPEQQEPTYWTLSEDPNDFVHVQKDRAKSFLIRRGILTEEDLTRPVVLYRGNLEKRRGIDTLVNAAPLFEQLNMRLVMMGERKNYPLDKLNAILKEYPDHITMLTNDKQIRQLSVFVRAAADFVIDPWTKPNHDDTIMAEGMIFGAAAITLGTGKLKHAMINRPIHRDISISYLDPDVISELGAVVTSYEYYNSYLYNNGQGTLETALRDASFDFEKLMQNNALREEFVLRMIRSAVNLGWDKGRFHGPVHEYNQVYQLALEDRFIPTMRRHEVEQEHELVSRLQDSFDN